MVKEFLSQQGVSYNERDVARDPSAAQEMVTRTGQRGVPVTLINGQTIIGFNKPALEQALAQFRSRPSFGAAIADVGRVTALRGTGIAYGAYIGRVHPDSTAEKLGLATGDIILEINQRHITGVNNMEDVLSHLNRGDQITIVFLRGNRTLTVNGTL